MGERFPASIAVLGATGSVGMQSLAVAERHGIRVDFITGNTRTKELEAQARRFGVRYCAVADESCARALAQALADTDIRVLSGEQGILEGIRLTDAETVVNAIIGEAGLLPTLEVLRTGKRLALSNKESLVVAGELVMRAAREGGCELIPVDSEHSAIFQCLQAGHPSEVRRILLTASGGPFYGYTRRELEGVTPARALAHPTWKMGAKITVDSATLMNKGFEVIEAVHLFGVAPSQIQVMVHRESILHSAVEYIDNTVIGQMSVPDMRSCIQYALTYPSRGEACIAPLDLFSVGTLSFARPDPVTFPLLSLAFRAIETGGAVPAVLNAANEVAVAGFLRGELSFTGIFNVVSETVERMTSCAAAYHTLEEILSADREARRTATSLL